MTEISIFFNHLLPILKSNIGAILFVPIYAVWVTCLLPGVWASMLAGAIYGTWMGTVLVSLGAFIGAICSFLLGRTIFRNWVKTRIESLPKLQKFLKGVDKEGLKLILMTRLSPIFPFSILNFAYGFSEISFRNYVLGLIGILPGTILFCALGNLAGDVTRFSEILSSKDAEPFSFLNIIGLLATILTVLILNNVIKQSFQES